MSNNNLEEKKNKRLTERRNLLVSALAVTVIIFIVSLLSLFTGDREYSENENRYLQQKPGLSLSSVADGKFMEETEKYLSDQFFLRDSLVRMRTAADIFIGKKESNGVYIGKNHFLFEKPSAYDKKLVKKTAAAINAVTANNRKISSYIAIAPNSTEILRDLLPDNAPNTDQQKQIKKIYSKLQGINCIDLVAPLKKSKNPEKLYYRTDHHWTYSAAKKAFKMISSEMKLDSSKIKYRSMAVTNSFRGTMASSSGVFRASDTIKITVAEPEPKYVVSYPEENKKSSSVFDKSKLDTNSKYEVFFGGNFPLVKIDTAVKTNKTLLVIKDSYANCVIPMLIPYYKTIVIIDPRYYADNIQETIEKESVTDMLWLYNADTFLNDTSIYEKLS